MDNQVINKQGRSRSLRLCREAAHLWLFAQSIRVSLHAVYLPGLQNQLADSLSCHLDLHEWLLDSNNLAPIFQEWGMQTVDLFASDDNARCSLFCSICPSPHKWASDAFLVSWEHYLLYVFPPSPFKLRTLLKAWMDKAFLILIAPQCPRQVW